MIKVEPLSGEAKAQAMPALAELRIKVFREWPYLYDGSLEYEADYLEKFSEADDSLIVVAWDRDKIVGASTASPLMGHASAFAEPFEGRGYDPEKIFYFGESVLLPDYRGHGIGHAFFDHREQFARQLGGFELMTFCAVERDADDPRRARSYRSLDSFWKKRGFQRLEGLTAHLGWKEPEIVEEVDHVMQFWGKGLF